ncbi:thioredoxin-like protein [Xylogone sp. PMI_703]|nr:thioredoxin-like protein [Xylogone sp. PMI_703]
MSPTVHIESASEFRTLLSSSTIVVTDFYADWCGPCRAIAPTYESLSTKHSKPKRVTFTKVNVDNQREIAQQYGVTAMPTFMIFRSGSVIETIRGADARKLTDAIESAVKSAGPATSVYSSAGRTLGGTPVSSQSASQPWKLSTDGLMGTIITFLGLYIVSLLSFDPYAAAQKSQFNVNNKPISNGKVSGPGRKIGGAPQTRRMGTMADIS